MATSHPERVRAGGRSERIRQRVGRACLELLAEGVVELSPADVAQRAGVSRATIYRWWPTPSALAGEALAEHTGGRLDAPDTGSWTGDLHALARRLATFFADPVEVSLNAIMAGGRHRAFDETVLRHYEPLFDGWRAMVERARARGELREGVDADTVLMTLASPLLVQPLVFHRRPRDAEVDRIAALVVAATAA